MRTFAVALVLASVVVAAPAFADRSVPVAGDHAVQLVWTPAMIAKVKEQIGIHEARAAALQPVVARDTAARDGLVTDALALDKAATDEHAAATVFRDQAAAATDPKTRADFTTFATELDNQARHSEASAKTHREIAARLDPVITTMSATVAYHLAIAAKLKTALANNS